MSQRISKTKFITRIITFFSKGDIKRTPLESLKRVKVDSYLISLGLLSQQFGVEGSASQAFWKRSHQLIVLFLQWFMFIKWIVCSSLSGDYIVENNSWIGDFTVYIPGDSFDYHFLLILLSSISALTASLFSIARKHYKLDLLWLRPFELCKGGVKDIKLGLEEASDFWQRVIFTLWVSKAITRILFLISVGVLVWIFKNYWPRDQLYFGIVWAVVTVFWLYYMISIQFGVMAVLHMLCYYFISKFRKLNEIVRELEANKKVELMVMHQKINTFMHYHNGYAKELANYNKFWQYYMAFNFIIYTTVICFFIELILFTKMILLYKILSMVAIFAFFLFLLFSAFSAGAVSDEIHESYGVLNAISKNNMPIVLKTQLQIYIQRIGGPAIGFSCWDLFTITYDGFFHTILMIGSFFLLFMDVTQSEKKKRRNVPVQTLKSPMT